MGYLLDTHFVLWLLFDYKKINPKIKTILENRNNEIFISQISLWEISLKYGLGKLDLYNSKPDEIQQILILNGYKVLDLKSENILSFYNLPQHIHKDPFDKMLVWQAIKSNLTLISQDKKLEVYQQNGLKIMY
ncbi:MAG: type II toxin-antitoxin system VapC family toxin [Sphingobacteriales bacterium]|nr:MAG: type II toxin-antitoxin system VapC family toxin [Sphingobacteriales bacterium]